MIYYAHNNFKKIVLEVNIELGAEIRKGGSITDFKK